jgi:hypothetical protein
MADDKPPPSEVEPRCEKCSGVTALLSFIPRFGNRPGYRIFECDACKALTWIAEKIGE